MSLFFAVVVVGTACLLAYQIGIREGLRRGRARSKARRRG